MWASYFDETMSLDNHCCEGCVSASAKEGRMPERKRRWATRCHRYLANPRERRVAGRLPGQALLETRGRRTGRPRRTPVGGRLQGNSFWMVSDHGTASSYVKNIQADNRVRLQVR